MTPEQMLRDLLAVIHRDGGHYTEEHGLQKSFDDAIQRYYDLLQAKEEAEYHISRLQPAKSGSVRR